MNKMPMEPDSVIWSALLGGCRKHDETKLAKLVVVKLRELQSRNLSIKRYSMQARDE